MSFTAAAVKYFIPIPFYINSPTRAAWFSHPGSSLTPEHWNLFICRFGHERKQVERLKENNWKGARQTLPRQRIRYFKRRVMFIKTDGDWDFLKYLGKIYYVDFYLPEGKSFYEKMEQSHRIVINSLKYAQDQGYDYVLFNYGASTSRPVLGSPRSAVRSIMRSKEAAPYTIKKKSIQHESVFLVAIKPKIVP